MQSLHQAAVLEPCMCQVSFCEKTKQGQNCIQRDWPGCHVFTDAMHVVEEQDRNNIVQASSAAEAEKALQSCTFVSKAKCMAHKEACSLPQRPDVSLFGAPCVDDSPMGPLKKDDGAARRAISLHCVKLCSHMGYFYHVGLGLSHARFTLPKLTHFLGPGRSPAPFWSICCGRQSPELQLARTWWLGT